MNRPSHHAIRSLINGQTSETISVLDRGLQYGDGVFETIAVQQGKALLLDQHLSRLSAAIPILKFPEIDIELVEHEINSICEGIDRGILKLILTRGSGGRGYSPTDIAEPNRILMVFAWPKYDDNLSDTGVELRLCQTRLAKQTFLAGSKHLNRLEQVMARSEWTDDNIFEGLMMDHQDNIIEGTMSNLFLIKDDVLQTPDLSMCGVRGIVRNEIISLADQFNLTPEEKNISYAELIEADECFITNSIIGLLPVKQIEKNNFSTLKKGKLIRNHLLKHNMIAEL